MNVGAGRPLVLYVEDDSDLASIVAELLELDGFATAVAHHGRHALRLLDGGLRPVVIVCDLMMPELDGFGFLAELRRRGAHAPVLAVSAFEPYLEAAVPAGAAATLSKPFEPAELATAVRRLAAGEALPAPAPVPREDERARLEAVARLGLDRPSPGDTLGRFARRVARVLDAPVCLVSAITRDRQYWHASAGLPEEVASSRGAARQDSFCTHAVAARAALVVQDAASNPFFRDNWFVRQRGLRFYAGVPLFAQHGEAVGTLCLLDFAPRGFGFFDLELLGTLARRVVAELEGRERHLAGAASARSAFRGLDDWDEAWDVLGRGTLEQALRVEALRAAERRWPLAAGVVTLGGADPAAAVRALEEALPAAHLGRLGERRLAAVAPRMAAEDLRAALLQVGAGAVAEQVARPGAAEALLAAMEGRLAERR